MTAATALQAAIRSKLIADRGVTSLVDPDVIFDGTVRPEDFPCIIIGDGHTMIGRVSYGRRTFHEFHSIHVWTAGQALEDAKVIAGAVADALADGVGDTIAERVGLSRVQSYRVPATTVSGVRYMRDPTGRCLHAIVEFAAIMDEVA